MVFKIDAWKVSGRGVAAITSYEATTKREANRIAESARADESVKQTVVTFPNGRVRICRNTRAKATAQ